MLGASSVASPQEITQILERGADGARESFLRPRGIAVTPSGELLAAGSGSNNVWSVARDGHISLVVGPPGDSAGALVSEPVSTCTDSSGRSYVASWHSDNVLRVEQDGSVTLAIDSGGDGQTALHRPFAITCGTDDSLYVAGVTSCSVFKVTSTGTVSLILDQSGDGQGHQLGLPHGIAVDSNHNVYVSGYLTSNVFKVSPSGSITLVLDSTGSEPGHQFLHPGPVAVDRHDNAFVAGFASDNVFKITPLGAVSRALGPLAGGQGLLDGPWGLGTSSRGSVIVAALNSHSVFEVTPTGAVALLMDESGDGNGNGLITPSEIAVGPLDDIFVCGFNSDNVFRISGAGVPFCFGDDISSCPCANAGEPEHGCANSTSNGARLDGANGHSIQRASLTLAATNLVPDLLGIYLQGDHALNGGSGKYFGDGLRCVGGNLIRLQVRAADAHGNSRTDLDIVAATGVSAGETKLYQLWYRDTLNSPCGAGFNLTNGLRVAWTP
jgi:hypothetical protein